SFPSRRSSDLVVLMFANDLMELNCLWFCSLLPLFSEFILKKCCASSIRSAFVFLLKNALSIDLRNSGAVFALRGFFLLLFLPFLFFFSISVTSILYSINGSLNDESTL